MHTKCVSLKRKYDTLPLEVKAAIWFLFCSVMQKGISVLTTPVYTRLMTTFEYGRFSYFNSWMDIVAVFITLRLYYGVYTQGLIKFDKNRDRFSSSLQGLTLFMILIWFVIYFFTQNFWNSLFKLSFPEMVAMFVLIWTTAIFSFWAAEQRVDLHYRKLVIVSLLVAVLKPALGIPLVYFSSHKVLARIWSIVLIEFLGFTWMFFDQVKRGRRLFTKDVWIYALKFNIPLIPHYLAQVVLSSSDRIMITQMVGEDKAGIYSLAYSISMLMLLVNTALQQTLNPWIYKKIKSRNFGDIHRIAYLSMVFVAIANVFLILIAPEAVNLFAPSSYYEAVWVIPPIAMSVFFIFLYNLFSAVEFYYEKSAYIAISTTIAAFFNIALNYLLIGKVGYIAAGYTTLVCYIIYATAHYFFMNKILRGDNCNNIYSGKLIVYISLSFMLVGFLLMTLYSFVISRYLIVAIILIALYINRKSLVSFFKPLVSNRLNNTRE